MSTKRWSSLVCTLALMLFLAPSGVDANQGKKDQLKNAHACAVVTALNATGKASTTALVAVCGAEDPPVDCEVDIFHPDCAEF